MDPDFHDLLRRYVNGDCTEEEIEKVHRWYAAIGDRELRLDEAEKTRVNARMLVNIRKMLPAQDKALSRDRYLLPHPLFKVAAAILVLAICGVWLFTVEDSLTADNRTEEISMLSDAMTFVNISDSSEVYALSDGSTVKLEPFSEIHFERDFSRGKREIHLTGKAFFDIVKDSARPFYVYSGKIATRVLGTSFFVDAPANAGKVEVKVITGKVSVFQIIEDRSSKDEKPSAAKNAVTNGVVLSPNQKVEYFIEGGHWVTGLVEDPVPVKPLEKETLSFVFDNTPLKAVLTDVSARYGIEVVTENEKICECTFTGDVSRMSLYDLLDVISTAVGSNYEVKGTRILINGRGCD
jgi:transmembrane sensor